MFTSNITHNNQLTTMPEAEQVESKRDKFIRLANKRLENALADIRLLRNLFDNPAAYDYNNKDIEMITAEIDKASNQLKQYWKG